jgi:hypothetical protein
MTHRHDGDCRLVLLLSLLPPPAIHTKPLLPTASEHNPQVEEVEEVLRCA